MKLKKFIKRGHGLEYFKIYIDIYEEGESEPIISDFKYKIKYIDILPYLNYDVQWFSSRNYRLCYTAVSIVKPKKKSKEKEAQK